MTTNNLKGVSPVIATILMVMITVGLVAFSYTWFSGIAERAAEDTTGEMDSLEIKKQAFSIPTAYEGAIADRIYFAFQTSSGNSLSMSPNTTHVSAYLNEEPRTIGTWDGGIGGTACFNLASKLTQGQICYGFVDANAGSCNSGDMLSFKLEHSWGAKKTITVICK